MNNLKFTKMQGSGNDFIVIEKDVNFAPLKRCRTTVACAVKPLARQACERKYGIGADGLLLLEKSRKADVRMRIFNADGSEAQMCGNGARCCALYISKRDKKKGVAIETEAGLLKAKVEGSQVKLNMTDPLDLKLDMKLAVGSEVYELDYLNTGVPHVVLQVHDLEDAPVLELGPKIRFHKAFAPGGTNVNFVKVKDKRHILIRTYERGVESETLACGTGSVAAAIIAVLDHSSRVPIGRHKPLNISYKVCVQTRSEEILKVYFKILKNKITDVWLQGQAEVVYTGEYHV